MDIELIADTIPQKTSFEDGAIKCIELLFELEKIPEFNGGWYNVNGIKITRDNIAETVAAMWNELGPDQEELGSFFVFVTEALHTEDVRGNLRPPYLFISRFGEATPDLSTELKISFRYDMAKIEFCRNTVRALLGWDAVQHVKIGPTWYFNDDTPIDVRRRGIGWAGWVPFSVTREQVPEADVLEPLAHGTFLSCQSRWINDGESIQRAQNLELRLNSLGVLPTFDDLSQGSWGSR